MLTAKPTVIFTGTERSKSESIASGWPEDDGAPAWRVVVGFPSYQYQAFGVKFAREIDAKRAAEALCSAGLRCNIDEETMIGNFEGVAFEDCLKIMVEAMAW